MYFVTIGCRHCRPHPAHPRAQTVRTDRRSAWKQYPSTRESTGASRLTVNCHWVVCIQAARPVQLDRESCAPILLAPATVAAAAACHKLATISTGNRQPDAPLRPRQDVTPLILNLITVPPRTINHSHPEGNLARQPVDQRNHRRQAAAGDHTILQGLTTEQLETGASCSTAMLACAEQCSDRRAQSQPHSSSSMLTATTAAACHSKPFKQQCRGSKM